VITALGQDASALGPIHNGEPAVDCRRHAGPGIPQKELRMKSRPHVSLVVAALLGVACTPSYVVVPASGASMAKANGGGLTLDAVPNAWDDDPTDLNRYMTPIWIRLVNHGKRDVRVVYADFALTNSSGFRYAAISPYPYQGNAPANPGPAATPPPKNDAAGASNETSDWYFDKGREDQEQAQLVALGDGTASVELVRYGGRVGGGGRMGGFGHVGPRYGGGYHGGYYGGFYGYPHYHGYYGYYGYYSPWPYFYAWPPYYGPYVYYWGPRYYPVGPTEDVMQRGLPEGVLHAGGSVSGFVYFQHAATQPTNLDLSWTPQGTDGKPLAALHVPLSVVED
jgi:hypothetical protein